MMEGIIEASDRSPVIDGDPVTLYTHQTSAILCMLSPMDETNCPTASSAKSLLMKGLVRQDHPFRLAEL